MESLLGGLQSTDIAARHHSTVKLIEWISKKQSINGMQADQKLRFIRHILTNIKDSNHKIVIASLSCLDLLLLYHSDGMTTFLNIAFDHTLLKLGDTKVTVRTNAFNVMVNILIGFGPVIAVEKLYVSIMIQPNIYDIKYRWRFYS